ncbi:MAG: hypothetical protein AB7U79_05320 [Candidatus Izemoplasmatales bacterium]
MNKKLFCVNQTNPHNTYTDDQPLVTKRASNELIQLIDSVQKETTDIEKQYRPYAMFRGGLYIILIIFIFILVDHIKSWGSLSDSYNKAAYLYMIFTVLMIVAIFYEMIYKSKLSEFKESPEYKEVILQQESMFNLFRDEFQLPEDEQKLTVLGFRYQIENDKMNLLPKNAHLYLPIALHTFVKNNILFLASIDQLVEISLENFIGIKRIDERINLVNWIERVSYRKEPYRKYKIRKTKADYYSIRPFYILTFKVDEVQYDLTLPVYEIAKFIQLTKIPYEDEYTILGL